jgi:hypothetical protein
MASRSVGRRAVAHAPCHCIAAARTNAAEPMLRRVPVTMCPDITMKPFEVGALSGEEVRL